MIDPLPGPICHGLARGVASRASCPDCHHRAGSHTLSGSCDVCAVLRGAATDDLDVWRRVLVALADHQEDQTMVLAAYHRLCERRYQAALQTTQTTHYFGDGCADPHGAPDWGRFGLVDADPEPEP